MGSHRWGAGGVRLSDRVRGSIPTPDPTRFVSTPPVWGCTPPVWGGYVGGGVKLVPASAKQLAYVIDAAGVVE